MSEEINNNVQEQQLPPIKIAFVLDGEVVDILHTDERLSAIFTSSPLIIDVTGQLVQDGGIIKIGTKWDYETQQFFIESLEPDQQDTPIEE